MKRIICIIAVLAIFLSGGSVLANPGYAGIEGADYETAANLLMHLGIMYPREDASFGAEEEVTRTDAVVALMRVLNYDNLSLPMNTAAESHFEDVEPEFWAVEDINLAYDLGIISPDANNRFRPDDAITVSEFSKMLVCAFGYAADAADLGGYPAGYMTMANRLSLLRGIKAEGPDTVVNRGAMAIMLYNGLHTPVRVAAIFSGETVVLREQGTALEVFLNITRAYGVVHADAVTALSGYSAVGDGYVLIDGMLCRTNEHISARGFLGHRVEFYYSREDGFQELKYLTVDKNTENSVELSSDMDYTYNQEAKSYEVPDENGKTRTYTAVYQVDVVYNGKLHNRCPVASMRPEAGYVELIDNNGDRQYDVIKIREYQAGVLAGYNDVTNSIALKNGETIPLDEVEYLSVTDEAGNGMKLIEAPVGAVLSIAASEDGELCEIVVCTDTLSGVFRLNSDGTIQIGETKYTVLSDVYIPNGSDIELDTNGVFYLDFMGNIAAYIDGSSLMRIGYLCGTAEVGTLQPQVLVRLFTTDNAFSEYACAKKVEIDEVSVQSGSDAFYQALNGGTEQLIRYKVNNNNEINYIETARTEGDGLRITGNNQTQTFRLNAMTLGGIYYTGNCGVFIIPHDRAEEYYRYTTSVHLTDAASYVFNAYEYDDDLRTDFLVCFEPTGAVRNTVTNANNLMMFDSCETMIDSEGNLYKEVVVYENCEKVRYAVKDQVLMAVLESVQKGDVIQISPGYDGYATGLRKIYDRKNNEGMVYGDALKKNSIMCGYIVKSSDDIIRFIPSKNDTTVHSDIPGFGESGVYSYYGRLIDPDLTEIGGLYRLDINVMVYDSALSDEFSCYSISSDDIAHLLEKGKAQFAVLKASYGVPKSIFVIQ